MCGACIWLSAAANGTAVPYDSPHPTQPHIHTSVQTHTHTHKTSPHSLTHTRLALSFIQSNQNKPNTKNKAAVFGHYLSEEWLARQSRCHFRNTHVSHPAISTEGKVFQLPTSIQMLNLVTTLQYYWKQIHSGCKTAKTWSGFHVGLMLKSILRLDKIR